MATQGRRFALALMIAGTVAPIALAQYSGGGIIGDGKAGDQVTIEAPATGVKRETTLKEDGKYRFSKIPVGVYIVRVTHKDGTQDNPKQITVQLGTTARVM
jgi:hypothetical protein